ncbi:hypothetical protein FHS76_003182 [Ochrobactrum daejeonense]|uniref:Uncharacterized protein n=1 Tax=Brucella daejeonensis TaxID=659015 RepID=A0A7W9AZE9_9HYPH|nr:hypothetical protein [Brucella daejeonensis]MBB5703282.1 hypothetical protein [Brucella daejeonensis]
MLLHVNNDMENGVIAKIPLALDKDVKSFQGDAIDFEISSGDNQLIPAEDIHPYKSIFKILSGSAELKNIFLAVSFNANFTTPDGKKTCLTRSGPTEEWNVLNGTYYTESMNCFGFKSSSRFSGNFGVNLTNPYLYVIKNGMLTDNKMSDNISIRAQFYPSAGYSVITPKEDVNIVISNRQNMAE